MNLKLFKVICPIIIGLILISACSKDDKIDLTGNLIVIFGNNAQYLSKTILPSIYVLDSDYPLLTNIGVDANGVLKVNNLNYGNYVLYYYKQYSNGSNVTLRKLFQINAGKTTEIKITID